MLAAICHIQVLHAGRPSPSHRVRCPAVASRLPRPPSHTTHRLKNEQELTLESSV
uniref:Uncharacterized protein n=1 Tax=Oryza glumipatula TaxID=40148 RepID=A0A0D9ZZS3_9ORYZ